MLSCCVLYYTTLVSILTIGKYLQVLHLPTDDGELNLKLKKLRIKWKLS